MQIINKSQYVFEINYLSDIFCFIQTNMTFTAHCQAVYSLIMIFV